MKRKGREPGDSPITVGGGGGRPRIPFFVELEFNHNHYVPDPDDTDNWVSEDKQLDYVDINGAHKPAVNKVVVKYKGGAGKITFKGNPVGVRFTGTDLPYKSGKHHGEGLELKNVTIDGGAAIPLSSQDKIYVHTK